MAKGWAPQDILKGAKSFGAGVTEEAVSTDAGLYASGAMEGFRVDFDCSAVTSSTGITAKLQMRTLDAWTDLAGANASVAITANGEYSLKQHVNISADQPNFPLQKQLRLVVTTGAGDAVTFDSVKLLQSL